MNAQTSRWRRAPALLIVFVGPLALLGAVGATQDSGRHTERQPTAQQKFKNIQVLKKLPADQLLPTMHTISNSLGVRCDFCHVVRADHTGFELDTKPTKTTARKMMIMVQSINAHQKILGDQATCYMCHHGHPEPETKAPPEARGPQGAR